MIALSNRTGVDKSRSWQKLSPLVVSTLLVSALTFAIVFAEWNLRKIGVDSGAMHPRVIVVVTATLLAFLQTLSSPRCLGLSYQTGVLYVLLAAVSLWVMSQPLTVFADTLDSGLSAGPRVLFGPDDVDGIAAQRVSGLTVDPGVFFLMDGAIDKWVYAFFKLGLYFVPYEAVPVQEHGILILFSLVTRLMGEFNLYYLLLTNWICHVASVPLLFALARSTFGTREAHLASTLFLLFPENLYWGGAIGKDGIVVFLVLGLVVSLCFMLNGRWRYHIVYLLILTCLAFTRSGVVAVMVVAGTVSYLAAGLQTARRLPIFLAGLGILYATLATALPAPVAFDLNRKIATRTVAKIFGGSSEFLDVENIRFRTTAADSFIYRFAGGNISIKTLHYVPIRIACYLLAPFPPFEIRFEGDKYLILSAYIIALLFSFSGLGFLYGIVRVRGTALVVPIHFLMIGLALSLAGPFVYERYRLLLTPFYFTMAATGFCLVNWQQRCWLFGLSVLIWSIPLAMWLGLK